MISGTPKISPISIPQYAFRGHYSTYCNHQPDLREKNLTCCLQYIYLMCTVERKGIKNDSII